MASRSGNLEGAPSLLLSVNIGQVVLRRLAVQLNHRLCWRLC